MKKYLILLFLFLGACSYSQSFDKNKNAKHISKIVLPDSIVEKIQRSEDSVSGIIPVTGNEKINYDFSGNIDSLMSLQKEQREKKKRQAIIRIAIGLAFLVLLIAGLRRKK